MVAHFLDRLLFCLFAEDAGLLPTSLIERLAENTKRDAAAFTAGLADLFARMSTKGGLDRPAVAGRSVRDICLWHREQRCLDLLWLR